MKKKIKELFDDSVQVAGIYPLHRVEMEQARFILEDAGVKDAKGRVEWFNVMTLDLGDLKLLSEVDFQIRLCDHCGAREYWGEPDNWSLFQGVNGNEGLIGPVNAQVNEQWSNADLCSHCIAKVEEILGI